MNGRHRLAILLCVASFSVAVGCAESESSADSNDPATGTPPTHQNQSSATGTPPTHQNQTSEEALIPGTLDGTLDCMWIEIGQERHALVLTEGSFTRAAENVVVLLAPDGSEVARTGDEVMVTGGFNPGVEPCADADATGHTIVAGNVERSE